MFETGRFSGQAESTDDWILVLEFQPSIGQAPIQCRVVHELIEELRGWCPSALYSPDRYALQLHVPASRPSDALRWGLELHDQAIATLGAPVPVLVRTEVMTGVEFQSQWDDPGLAANTRIPSEPVPLDGGPVPLDGRVPPDGAGPLDCTSPNGTSPGGGLPGPGHPERMLPESMQSDTVMSDTVLSDTVLSDDVYWATRAMLRAVSPSELAEVLSRFVTTVGGRIQTEPGAGPGEASFDLALEAGDRRCAVVDDLSVAALIMEQSLPTLVADARRALARLHKTYALSSNPGYPHVATGDPCQCGRTPNACSIYVAWTARPA